MAGKCDQADNWLTRLKVYTWQRVLAGDRTHKFPVAFFMREERRLLLIVDTIVSLERRGEQAKGAELEWSIFMQLHRSHIGCEYLLGGRNAN